MPVVKNNGVTCPHVPRYITLISVPKVADARVALLHCSILRQHQKYSTTPVATQDRFNVIETQILQENGIEQQFLSTDQAH